ncbi:hypothetical protein [Caldiplasma sukawensis]
MVDRDYSKGKGGQENVEEKKKEIDKVIEFLDRFIEASRNKKDDNVQVDTKGHIVWKEKEKKQSPEKNKDRESNADKEADDEYNEDYTFYSIEFEFHPGSLEDLAKVIKTKLNNLKKRSETQFKINEKLPQGHYGYDREWNKEPKNKTYSILINYQRSLTRSITSDYRKDLVKKDKNGNLTVKDTKSCQWRGGGEMVRICNLLDPVCAGDD